MIATQTRQTANAPATPKRAVVGWFFMITGFLACPCHLIITLPLIMVLLSGTAAGGWIAAHSGAIAVGASIYFVGGLAVGAFLLPVRSGAAATSSPARRPVAGSPCCPPHEAAPPASIPAQNTTSD